ncbi:hypothetical protein GUITHDRAFT_119715 [Guillardia theta CCMP2712]|uniref:RWP-RK domain-containing protein n=1 Tax=Guillardia theta (strain CCMP2712) TaxID=905079 RepID=L1IDC5_GUITC|nr:hypothetical protein GUITHDRAFT_119715 [Guillardia theta CCMP2712]EKX34107.1 hypothetical protein GUITHDRAFT_119715 [Guillardia theta CCMP2712]|eukprot:XP_005821087.1 hypothetical protein GUITHDRAFT_119715 [Guillardia theta CCMP2712]
MLAPAVTIVLPRKKPSDGDNGNREIALTAESISKLFKMRQSDAAKHLGISLTALKSACRRVGVHKWPYIRHRPRCSLQDCSLQEYAPKKDDNFESPCKPSGWLMQEPRRVDSSSITWDFKTSLSHVRIPTLVEDGPNVHFRVCGLGLEGAELLEEAFEHVYRSL